MVHSGPAGSKLENKYLDFSLFLPFYFLLVSLIVQAQPKPERERESLVIESIEIIL